MKKSIIGVAVTSLALALCLTACGGSSAPDTEPETNAPEETQTEQVELDTDALLSKVFDACPLDMSQASDIKIGAVKDGAREVTFNSEAGPFSYTVDAYTGEILDKTEPEVSAEVKASDPMETAINACFDSVEGYSGGAENIHIKETTVDGAVQYEVEFDWNGQHYDMFYDVASGQVIQ